MDRDKLDDAARRGRRAAVAAKNAAARVHASRRVEGTESPAPAQRAEVFPPADAVRDRAVAVALELDDPTPDLSVGGLVVDVDALILAGLLICDDISRHTAGSSRERSGRMDNVVRRRFDELAERVGQEFNPETVLGFMADGWDEPTRLVALIELTSTDPFSPFDLRHSRSATRAGLTRVAAVIGSSESELATVQQTLKDATLAHTNQSLARVGLWGVGGAVILGAVGLAAAPALGAALGSAAGLSGAAATSFGLSTLGGGSLAAGGLGMTGGLWMVSGTAAATGLVSSGGGALLYTLGGRQVRAEVVKLQATYKLVLLRSQADVAIAQRVVQDLHADAEFLREQVADEREVNDANSRRIKELESKIEAIEEAIEWMDSLDPAAA